MLFDMQYINIDIILLIEEFQIKEMNTMKTREEAYEYLIKNGQGETKILKKEIGEDIFDELRLIGFIKEGMDGNWVERWQITSFGKEQISAYLKFCEIAKEVERLCKNILS